MRIRISLSPGNSSLENEKDSRKTKKFLGKELFGVFQNSVITSCEYKIFRLMVKFKTLSIYKKFQYILYII